MSESSLHRPFVPTDPPSHSRPSTCRVTPYLAIPPYDTTVLDELRELAPDPDPDAIDAIDAIEAPPGADIKVAAYDEGARRRYSISRPRGADAAIWDFVARRLLGCPTGHFFVQLLQQFRSDYHHIRQMHRIIDGNND